MQNHPRHQSRRASSASSSHRALVAGQAAASGIGLIGLFGVIVGVTTGLAIMLQLPWICLSYPWKHPDDPTRWIVHTLGWIMVIIVLLMTIAAVDAYRDPSKWNQQEEEPEEEP